MLSLSEGTNPPSQAEEEENPLLITHFSARFHFQNTPAFQQNTPGNLPNTPAFASFPTSFFLKTLENRF